MRAGNLQLIRVSAEQVVLKRGVHELLVSGADAAVVVGYLVDALGQAATPEQALSWAPENFRGAVEQLLRRLRARQLLDAADGAVTERQHTAETAFFRAMDRNPEEVRARLRDATLVVFGVNRVSRALVRSLRGLGPGTVRLIRCPGLDMPEAAGPPSAGAAGDGADLWVATAEAGSAADLLAVNRRAIAAGVPFLPAWLTAGAVWAGPLRVPGETACLRCFTSRQHEPDPGAPDGVTPARSAAALCASIVAMEVLKYLVGRPPSSVVGRSHRLDLRTLAATARRVLRVPRCPDCSELARHAFPAVLTGPQIRTHLAGDGG